MSDRAAELQRVLEVRGYRLTPARRAILAALTESDDHVTADELAALVQSRTPGVGRMTVYRTLELLCDLGLLRPVYQGTGAAHYVRLQDGHHHHLVCSRCARVIEFDDCALGDLPARLAHRFGFRVEGHLLELYGLCEECDDGRAADA